MKFLILGAGGIGAYFGARLINAKNEVTFVARGKHLETLQQNGLKVLHPEFEFYEKVVATDFDTIQKKEPNFDAILISTKSTSTLSLATNLQQWLEKNDKTPFIISLQNGVENEELLCKYLDKKYIIGGLTRKIGAHIINSGHISATGNAETILGVLESTKENEAFLKNLVEVFNKAKIPTAISQDIEKELWKKLVINNGVNAICALLRQKTGVIMHHEKLSNIVYNLMKETAKAALNKNIKITKQEVEQMYELIKNFDSIKPSMLVDVENNREIELDEICNVVIKNCEAQGVDASYTRVISTLLEYTYKK